MIWAFVLCALVVPLLTAMRRPHLQAGVLSGPSDGYSLEHYAFQVAPFAPFAPFALIAWLAGLPGKRWAQLPALGLIAFGSLEFQLKPLSGPRWRDELREVTKQPTGPCAAGAPLVVLRLAPDPWSVHLPAEEVCAAAPSY